MNTPLCDANIFAKGFFMDKINFLEDELEDLKKTLFEKSSSKGAIGKNATTSTGGAAGDNSSSTNGFAGGENAIASASGSVQLGDGTNTEANTLKFHSYQLLESNGKIPNDRFPFDTNPTSESNNLLSSGSIYSMLNISSPTNATLNSSFVDTNTGGEVVYTKIGNIVFVQVNDITFKNTKQEHGSVLFSNLPKASIAYTFCMTCWGGSITTLRVRIYQNDSSLKNYWSAFTPSTAQKWSGSFVYLCK